MSSPSPDGLTDTQVAAIVRAQDEARVRLDEIHVDERRDAVEGVIAAFVAAGLDRDRAARAATVWLIERVDPVECVRRADEERPNS